MQKTESKQNHMKKRYLSYINGPILFTAPHSKKLMRGGPQYNEQKRLHLRQLYTSYIACQLANITGKNSFCIWGKSATINEQQLDPNYLLPQMFQNNPFHQSLHYWAIKNHEKPILHVDIHGKFNRKNNCELDVGMASLEGYTFQDFQCKVNTDPALHGYWGGGICTMTEQAAMLNIPSFQLEIPHTVRQKLFKDQKLLLHLGKKISKLYHEVIVPWNQQRKLKVSKKIMEIFNPSIKTEKEKEELLQQVTLFQKKQEANFNAKFV